MDDSHLCGSHGVGAVRVAKQPKEGVEGGKGTAWVRQYLKAQAQLKT